MIQFIGLLLASLVVYTILGIYTGFYFHGKYTHKADGRCMGATGDDVTVGIFWPFAIALLAIACSCRWIGRQRFLRPLVHSPGFLLELGTRAKERAR